MSTNPPSGRTSRNQSLSIGDHQSSQDHGEAEYRRKASAQDGRIKLKVHGREIDVRVSVIDDSWRGYRHAYSGPGSVVFDLRKLGMESGIYSGYDGLFTCRTALFSSRSLVRKDDHAIQFIASNQ